VRTYLPPAETNLSTTSEILDFSGSIAKWMCASCIGGLYHKVWGIRRFS
jgi:hypothetical protein